MSVINWAVNNSEVPGYSATIQLSKGKGNLAEVGTVEETGVGTFAQVIVFYNESEWKLFQQLVNRAVNCWDRAPARVKAFADIITEGKILQNYEDLGSEVKQP